MYNQKTKSQTLHNTGRLKISLQTPRKGQGRPTYRSQTGAVGLSRQASHKTRTDSAKEMREDIKSGLKCVTSRSWSQFSLFLHPNAFTSSLFIICGQLVYLKLSSAEKIYLRLSLIISTYCVIFTRFPELLRGIINNKRWENLLADAEHAHCKWLLTHSNAQMETGWVLHRGVPSSVEQDAWWPLSSQRPQRCGIQPNRDITLITLIFSFGKYHRTRGLRNVDHNFLISKWSYLYHTVGNQV